MSESAQKRKRSDGTSRRTKKRRKDHLAGNTSYEELKGAMEVQLQDADDENSKTMLAVLKKEGKPNPDAPGIFTPEEALALLLDLDFARDKYQILRNRCIEKNLPDLFPVYDKVKTCFQKFYMKHCWQS